MWGWICGGVALVAAIAFVWVFLRGNVYRRLFADEHFLEAARGVARVKIGAMENPVSEDAEVPSPEEDPRVLMTSAGLVLFYTVRRVDERFVHHYSVSVAGGYTAHAVGETFVLLTARALGIAYDRLALGVGASTVHHAEFELSEDENESFRARPVPEMSAADVDAFRKEWLEVRDRLHWQHERNAG